MKIGIFGGSFNPPHKMHKDIALNLIINGYLDSVIYVPTGNKYNKQGLIDADIRLEMIKIMIKNNKNLSVSDYEIKNVLTYTYQTLDYFKEKYPNEEIYFICGSDNIKEIKTWRNYEYILNNFKVIVIKRNSDNLEDILTDINSSNIIIPDMELSNISSTYIRNNINSVDIKEQIDENVLEYIEKKKLYYLH